MVGSLSALERRAHEIALLPTRCVASSVCLLRCLARAGLPGLRYPLRCPHIASRPSLCMVCVSAAIPRPASQHQPPALRSLIALRREAAFSFRVG